MTIQEVIQDAFLIGKGKANALAVTSSQYIKFLALANMLQKKLIREPGVQWDWTYDRLSLGTITSDRVELDETVYAIHRDEEDPIVIVNATTGAESYWTYVKPAEFKRYKYAGTCTLIQGELIFSKVFTATDPEYNGEIIAPVHIKPEDYTSPSEEVVIPDPEWLATMIAAESVRNSVTKQNQLGNLIGDANNLLEGMKENNNGSISQIPLYTSVQGESWGSSSSNYTNSAGGPLGE